MRVLVPKSSWSAEKNEPRKGRGAQTILGDLSVEVLWVVFVKAKKKVVNARERWEI